MERDILYRNFYSFVNPRWLGSETSYARASTTPPIAFPQQKRHPYHYDLKNQFGYDLMEEGAFIMEMREYLPRISKRREVDHEVDVALTNSRFEKINESNRSKVMSAVNEHLGREQSELVRKSFDNGLKQAYYNDVKDVYGIIPA